MCATILYIPVVWTISPTPDILAKITTHNFCTYINIYMYIWYKLLLPIQCMLFANKYEHRLCSLLGYSTLNRPFPYYTDTCYFAPCKASFIAKITRKRFITILRKHQLKIPSPVCLLLNFVVHLLWCCHHRARHRKSQYIMRECNWVPSFPVRNNFELLQYLYSTCIRLH